MHFELNCKINILRKIVFAGNHKIKMPKKIRFFTIKTKIEITILGFKRYIIHNSKVFP